MSSYRKKSTLADFLDFSVYPKLSSAFVTMVSLVVVLCGVSMTLYGVYGGLGNEKQGPYDIITVGVKDCTEEGEDALIKFDIKFQKANRTTLLVGGQLDSNITLSDDIKVKLSVDQYSSQRWKEKFYYAEFADEGCCSVLKKFCRDTATNFLKALGNEDGNCPIPSGTTPIAMFPFEFKTIPGIPTFFYGRFKLYMRLHYPELNSPQIGCLVAEFKLVPKRKSG